MDRYFIFVWSHLGLRKRIEYFPVHLLVYWACLVRQTRVVKRASLISSAHVVYEM